jgi:predicted NBD/HSP70 family sugar kinase
VALANSGDRRAREAVRETAEFLALGIGNILAGLNPEYVIVDGELTKAWDILDAVMKKSLLRGVFGLEYKNVKIIPPPLKEKPSLVGAISLALSGHFAPPALH